MNWSEKHTQTERLASTLTYKNTHSHGRMNLFEQASASKYISNNNIIYSTHYFAIGFLGKRAKVKRETLFKWKWKYPKKKKNEKEKTQNPFGNCIIRWTEERINCIYLKDKSTWIIELKYEFISQNWTQFFVQIKKNYLFHSIPMTMWTFRVQKWIQFSGRANIFRFEIHFTFRSIGCYYQCFFYQIHLTKNKIHLSIFCYLFGLLPIFLRDLELMRKMLWDYGKIHCSMLNQLVSSWSK